MCRLRLIASWELNFAAGIEDRMSHIIAEPHCDATANLRPSEDQAVENPASSAPAEAQVCESICST